MKSRKSGSRREGRGKSGAPRSPRKFEKGGDRDKSRNSGSDRPAPRKRSFDKEDDRPRKVYTRGDDDRSQDRPKRGSASDSRNFDKRKGRPDKPERPSRSGSDDRSKRPFERNSSREGGERREKSYSRSSERRSDSDSRPSRRNEEKPERSSRSRSSDDRPKRPFERNSQREGSEGREKSYGRSSDRRADSDSRPPRRKDESGSDGGFAPRKRSSDAPRKTIYSGGRPYKSSYSRDGDRSGPPRKRSERKPTREKEPDGTIRLNKYIAHAGICSRREADDLILAGAVSVNGQVITEMGYKVQPTDKIQYGGQTLSREQAVYVLLNKPKDYITTTDDPQKRKTVFELVQGICKERIYPVGRLDRNTTGVLLLTNDGELAKKLMHPRYGIRKIYQVTTDKNVSKLDLAQMLKGVELEDGFVKVDSAEYVGDGKDKKEIGIELHSGRNRVVRRLMEHFGYQVIKLDRVVFAGLTKKDLPRGKARILTEKEVTHLKMQASNKS